MPIVEWSSRFVTGHALVDQQHQELFRLVNELHDAMRQGKGRSLVGKTLEALAAYTANHFRTEEALMARTAYPGAGEHKAAHEALLADAGAHIAAFKEGKDVNTVELSSFLAAWIRHHIELEDNKLIQFLRMKGQK